MGSTYHLSCSSSCKCYVRERQVEPHDRSREKGILSEDARIQRLHSICTLVRWKHGKENDRSSLLQLWTMDARATNYRGKSSTTSTDGSTRTVSGGESNFGTRASSCSDGRGGTKCIPSRINSKKNAGRTKTTTDGQKSILRSECSCKESKGKPRSCCTCTRSLTHPWQHGHKCFPYFQR